MERSNSVKYMFYDIDDLFTDTYAIKREYEKENVYLSHDIYFLENGNYMTIFKIL